MADLPQIKTKDECVPPPDCIFFCRTLLSEHAPPSPKIRQFLSALFRPPHFCLRRIAPFSGKFHGGCPFSILSAISSSFQKRCLAAKKSRTSFAHERTRKLRHGRHDRYLLLCFFAPGPVSYRRRANRLLCRKRPRRKHIDRALPR